MIEHKGTEQLETERLILRKATMDDVQSMFDNWASDKEVTEYLTWAPHSDIDQTAKYIESMIGKYESDDYYDWLIEAKETGDVIGSIGFVRCFEDIDAFDVGYVLGRRWWGHGIMPEALSAVIEYAFTQLGAKRIGAQCDKNNRASEQVMKKCNFRYEGLIRKGARNNWGIVDILQYSIIAADFAGSRLSDKALKLLERYGVRVTQESPLSFHELLIIDHVGEKMVWVNWELEELVKNHGENEARRLRPDLYEELEAYEEVARALWA